MKYSYATTNGTLTENLYNDIVKSLKMLASEAVSDRISSNHHPSVWNWLRVRHIVLPEMLTLLE